MRKSLSFFILLIGLVICLAPLVDGYLFKKIYYQQIAYLAQQINDNNKNVQMTVQSYDMGWLKSEANVIISGHYGSANQVFTIKSIIHHGPLVHADNQWQFAYAYIETSVYLPAILDLFLPPTVEGFVQIHSRVTLNGDTWINHFTVPAITNQYVNWGGLSGDVVLDMMNGDLAKISGNNTVEKFSTFDVTLLPIKSSFDLTWQAGNMSGTTDSNMGGLSLKWTDASVFDLKNFVYHSTYSVSNGFQNIHTTFSVDSVQFPDLFPLFPDLSKITFSISFNQLNIADISQHYSKYSITQNPDELLKVLTAATTADMQFATNSDLGPASLALHASLLSLPKTKDEIKNNMDVTLNVQVAQTLMEKLVEDFIKKPASQAADLPKQANMVLGDMLQQGYIQQDKNDYIIDFSRKGLDSVLNGKPVTDIDLMNIETNVDKIIDHATVPPPPPPVVAPVKPVVIVPVVKP